MVYITALFLLFAAADSQAELPRRGPGLVPAGTSEMQLIYNSSSVKTRYSTSGAGEPLGGSFPHLLTWRDFGDAVGSQRLKQAIRDGRKSLNKPMTAVAGKVDPQISSGQNALVPKLAVGVNRFWTVQVILPMQQTDYQIRNRFVPAKDFRETLWRAGLDKAEQDEVIASLNEESQGSDFNLADAEFMNFVSLVSSFNFNAVGLAGFTVPSSKMTNKVSGRSQGSGQGQINFSLGTAFQFIHSSQATSQLTLLQTLPTPTNINITIVENGVPLQQNARLESGNVLNINWDLGFKFSDEFSAGTFYDLKKKARDQINGDQESQTVHRFLEQETDITEHSLGLSLSYTNNPQKLQGEQSFTMTLTASRPFAGKNVQSEEQLGLSLGFNL